MTPLHWIGEAVRDVLTALPLSAVRGLFLALPAIVLLWVLRLPREATAAPAAAGGGGRSANLKVGAAVALVLQIVLYSVL
jgi:hypothetical protein